MNKMGLTMKRYKLFLKGPKQKILEPQNTITETKKIH